MKHPCSFMMAKVPRRLAFSLVEVTMAIGIVSFGVLSLLALLPSGLQSVRDSANEAAMSAIVRSVRGELNQASFGDVVNTLPAQTWYFNEAGNRLEATAPETDRFFKISFDSSFPAAAGAADAFEESLRVFTLTIRYPAFAVAADQTTKTVTLLTARQTSSL